MSGSVSNNEKVNRSSRACLNCRKHKMKCENNDTPPCKRCEATGKNCIFTLRANAAIGTDHAGWSEQVEMRLYDLEVEVKSWRRGKHSSLYRAESGTGGDNKDDPDGEDDGELDDEEDDELGAMIDETTMEAHEMSIRGKKRRLTQGSNKDRPRLDREGSKSGHSANRLEGVKTSTSGSDSRPVGSIWELKEDVPDLITAIARGMGGLKAGSLTVDRRDMAWVTDTVEGLWSSFEQDFLPFTGTGIQRLSPAHLTPLLIASVLLVASKSLSGTHARTYENAFHLAFSQSDAHSGLDVEPATDPSEMILDGSDLVLEEDRKGYMDVLGLLTYCQAEVASKRSLSGHIAWAHQVILDSIGLGENVREEDWRALWDAFYVVDQQHRSLHLKRSIIHATPPAPPFSGHSAVSFPSAAEDMAKINEIGYKHFASRGFTSVVDRVWRRRGSARSKTEPKQVSIKDLAVLDNWLSQLKKCAQRYGQQDELPYLLDRLVIESIAASSHSAISNTDLFATARKLLEVHVTRPLMMATPYQLVVLTSAALQVLDDGNDGNRNVADLQLVLQLMIYLRNLGHAHLRRIATELHACLNQELAVLGSTNRLHMQGLNNDIGMTGGTSMQPPMGYTPTQIGDRTTSQADQDMHAWNPVTDHDLHQQLPDQLFGDFDPSFLPASSQNLSAGNVPFELRSMSGIHDHLAPRHQDSVRQPISLPLQPFQIQDALDKPTETWPPTFLSWLNTSTTEHHPDDYHKF